MIKKGFIFLFLIFSLLLAGCDKQYMDQPAEDGNFHYRNKDLKFSLVLPPEFLYYQTQRKETDDFIDIEFFVPTSDTDYLQEVQSYAKLIIIRVFKKDYWEDKNYESFYQKLKEKRGKIYTIRFWPEPPKDWLPKWSEEMKQNIIDGFKVK